MYFVPFGESSCVISPCSEKASILKYCLADLTAFCSCSVGAGATVVGGDEVVVGAGAVVDGGDEVVVVIVLLDVVPKEVAACYSAGVLPLGVLLPDPAATPMMIKSRMTPPSTNGHRRRRRGGPGVLPDADAAI